MPLKYQEKERDRTRASGFSFRSVRHVSPEKIPTLNCSVSRSSTYLPSRRFKNAAIAPSNIVTVVVVYPKDRKLLSICRASQTTGSYKTDLDPGRRHNLLRIVAIRKIIQSCATLPQSLLISYLVSPLRDVIKHPRHPRTERPSAPAALALHLLHLKNNESSEMDMCSGRLS